MWGAPVLTVIRNLLTYEEEATWVANEQLKPQAVVFVSDPSSREPRYRLTYSMSPDGVLLGSFELAPPGSPDAFKPYLSWKARRR